MSEIVSDKRYYVDIDEAIIDNETRRQYETWNMVDIEAICDKLNDYDKENKELQSIKSFAERSGINIFMIDEAFRRCWNDNNKLIDENKELKEFKDNVSHLIDEKISEETATAERIESVIGTKGHMAVNRLTINTLLDLKRDLEL